MKKLLSLFLAAIVSISCFGIFSACNSNIITIGYTDYPPMNYTDDNEELVGFDTELATATFTGMGYIVKFKLIEWGNKYQELNSGSIDCIWNGFTSNGDDDGVPRSQSVDFSYNYMINAQCILRLKNTAELSSVSEFDGTSVAYEAGSAGEGYVDGIEANINKKPVASQMTAVQEVLAKTAQYAVVDYLLAKSIAGQGNYANVVMNTGIDIEMEYYAVGFKKGSELTAKVNEQLVSYAQSGYLKTLAEKYGLGNQVITDFSDQMTSAK